MAGSLLDLYATLTLDSSEYESGLSEAQSSATSFGSTLSKAAGGAVKIFGGITAGATAVSGALVATASKTAAYGDEIDKSSQKLGISAKAYQEWDAVLKHSGTSMGSMGASFKKLANAAVDSSDAQVEAFEAIGLSMDAVKEMTTEQLWEATIEGLQGMEEGTERTAIATELLGRGAQDLGALLNTSAKDTAAMREEVNRLGGVMSDDAVKASAEFQDNLQDLQTGFMGIRNNIGNAVIPMLNGFMNTALDNFPAIQSAISGAMEGAGAVLSKFWDAGTTIFDAIVTAVENIGTATGNMGISWDSVWNGLSTVIDTVSGFIATGIETIGTIIAGLVTEAQTDGTLINTVFVTLHAVVGAAISGITSVIDGFASFFSGFIEAATTDGTTLNNIFVTIHAVISAAISGISSVIQGIVNLFTGDWAAAFSSFGDAANNVFISFHAVVGAVVSSIKTAVQGIVDFFQNDFLGAFDALSEGAGLVTGFIADLGSDIAEGLGSITSSIADWTVTAISDIGNGIASVAETVGGWFEDLFSFFGFGGGSDESSEVANKSEILSQAITENFNEIATILSNTSEEDLSRIVTNYNNMATDVETAMTNAYTAVSTNADNIKNKWESHEIDVNTFVSSGLLSIKNLFEIYLESIKSKNEVTTFGIQTAWETAMSNIQSKVSSVMSAIAMMFAQTYTVNVGVNGLGAPGVNKHAKAMNQPYILNGATIFGSMNGELLQGGEKGSEMVVGTSTMMGMISEASGSQQVASMVASVGEQIVGILGEYLPGMANQGVYIDGDALVGQITPMMDKSLGRIASRKGARTL